MINGYRDKIKLEISERNSWAITIYLPVHVLISPNLALYVLHGLTERLLADADYLPINSMQQIRAFLSAQRWAGGIDNKIKIKIINNDNSSCITFDEEGRPIFYQDEGEKVDKEFIGFLKRKYKQWLEKRKS